MGNLKELALDLSTKVLNIVLTLYAWLIVFSSLISGLKPPYFHETAILIILSAALILALVPPLRNKLKNDLSPRKYLAYRLVFVIIATLASAVMIENLQEKQLEALPPNQKIILENKKLAKEKETERREEAERQQAYLEEQEKSERERTEKLKDDLKKESAHQRDFYSQLGAPKLLYKCNGSYPEKAIGAKYGNINVLLSRAESDCGNAGYEVIKRKD